MNIYQFTLKSADDGTTTVEYVIADNFGSAAQTVLDNLSLLANQEVVSMDIVNEEDEIVWIAED
jgi:hypothetical protein